MKPVAGPMKRVAWAWNEPETGICTDSSPRQTITRYISTPATRPNATMVWTARQTSFSSLAPK